MRRPPKKLLVHPFDTVRLYAVSGYYEFVPYLAHFAQASGGPTAASAAGHVARPIGVPGSRNGWR